MEIKDITPRLLIIEYLRKKKHGLIFTFVCVLIMLAVSYLSQIALSESIYGIILCLTFGLAFMIYDFYQFQKSIRFLNRQFQCIGSELLSFEESGNLIEEEYQLIALKLQKDRENAIHDAETDKQDMYDYYSLWAHQVKTPIAAMNLLLQNYEDAPEQISISSLQEQLFRIEQYVEMVLSFLKIDNGSTDYVFAKYNLDDIIKKAIRKFAKQFIGRKLYVKYDFTDRTVLTDEKWLSFVIEQIFSNSLKYTHTGGITISVKNNNVNTFLIIEDTGIGVAPEDLPRVFENGYTGYNGRLDHKSTGIGLYLCKQILSKLGHGIRMESEVRKGTRIIITISNKLENKGD